MYSENFISKKLRTYAQRNDWLISGEYIYGEESGFLFTGMDSKKEKTFITPVPGITPDQESELLEILKKNENTMKLSAYEITDDFLSIRVKDSMSIKPEDLEFILALLTGAMQEVNIVAANRCQECKELDTHTTNFIYDLYCYMHDDCAKIYENDSTITENLGEQIDLPSEEIIQKDNIPTDESNEGIDNVADENLSEPFSYKPFTASGNSDSPLFKKIIYTIAGALLGSIPWIILPFVMDLANDLLQKITQEAFAANVVQSLLICLCAYFIPYFAIIGYRLSSGKFTTQGRWITGIVSGTVVLLIQFVYLAVLIIKEPSVTLNFANYMTNIVKFNFYINMLLGALIGLVFTLISVLPYFDSNKQQPKKSKYSSARVVDVEPENPDLAENSDSTDDNDSDENKEENNG